jgi:ribosomal protein L7/L12
MINEMVAEIETLVLKYGIHAVKQTVSYIDSINVVMPITTRIVRDGITGKRYTITEQQHKDLTTLITAYPSALKIQAIKLFREITSCGLKEAKDVIEGPDYMNSTYSYNR